MDVAMSRVTPFNYPFGRIATFRQNSKTAQGSTAVMAHKRQLRSLTLLPIHLSLRPEGTMSGKLTMRAVRDDNARRVSVYLRSDGKYEYAEEMISE